MVWVTRELVSVRRELLKRVRKYAFAYNLFETN
jgi:hypothetical protein